MSAADLKTTEPKQSGTKFVPGKSGNPNGRPKGVPNKTTTLLKDAIIKAAEEAGGEGGLVGYLTTQAQNNPASFLPLVGKVLPLQLAGDPEAPLQISITRKIVK